jgi:hypothetical protein
MALLSRFASLPAVFLTMVGCSSDAGLQGSGMSPEPLSFACDSGGASAHTCVDYGSASADLSSIKSSCALAHGVVRQACDRAGAIGGCRYTTQLGTSSYTQTLWSYAGTASELMGTCAATYAGATWVTP